MKKFNKYDNLINCCLNQKIRYVSTAKTIYFWVKNRNKKYTVLCLDDIKNKFKTSDTIFILGGGTSINNITKEQWELVSKHDSFAMNWWPLHDFIPTYYYTNYPQDSYAFKQFVKILSPKLANYKDTVFFVSGNRAMPRGLHPRVVPELFPENANCFFYHYKGAIRISKNEEFTTEHLKKTLCYRGGLTLILDLINRIGGYKRIVLLGVDLKNGVHFYDEWPEMQWQYECGYKANVAQLKKELHGTMLGRNKYPFSEYLYAVNDLYYKPNSIELFVGSDKSLLADKISVFKFDKLNY